MKDDYILIIMFHIVAIVFSIAMGLGIFFDDKKSTQTDYEIYKTILQGEYKYIDAEANYNPKINHTNYKIIYEDEYGQIKTIKVDFEQYYKLKDIYKTNQ